MKQVSPAKVPCKTCPYRKDVPSGVWAENEYRKLPEYDRPMHEQPHQMFYCHQRNGCLCSGWVASHGGRNLLSMRVHAHFGRVDPGSLNYESPVPVFASGAEAAAHGMRDIKKPGPRACRAVERLSRKIAPCLAALAILAAWPAHADTRWWSIVHPGQADATCGAAAEAPADRYLSSTWSFGAQKIIDHGDEVIVQVDFPGSILPHRYHYYRTEQSCQSAIQADRKSKSDAAKALDPYR